MTTHRAEYVKKVQLGYHVLMILSVLDGHYKQDEGREISDYLHRYLEEEELNIAAEANVFFLNNKAEEVATQLFGYVQEFGDMANREEKVELLYYAYKLITSHDEVRDNHRSILLRMGMVFGIDTSALLESWQALIGEH